MKPIEILILFVLFKAISALPSCGGAATVICNEHPEAVVSLGKSPVSSFSQAVGAIATVLCTDPITLQSSNFSVNVTCSASAVWIPLDACPDSKIYNASGTYDFTPVAGITSVRVVLVGGGSNAGLAYGNRHGGAGGWVQCITVAVTPCVSVAITVAASGGSSVFGNLTAGIAIGVNRNGGTAGGCGGGVGATGGASTDCFSGQGTASYSSCLNSVYIHKLSAGDGGQPVGSGLGGGGGGGVLIDGAAQTQGGDSQMATGGKGYGAGAGGGASTLANGASGLVYVEWGAH